MTADPIKYVVVCNCDGQSDVIAWIDDDRVTGNNPWVTHTGADIVRRTGFLRSDANGNLVATDRFQHPPCELGIRLNSRDTGELLDAVAEVQRRIGYSTIPVALYGQPIEERIVIPFDLLCAINGRLQRRKTTTRRKLP